jgi:hypothetical protein
MWAGRNVIPSRSYSRWVTHLLPTSYVSGCQQIAHFLLDPVPTLAWMDWLPDINDQPVRSDVTRTCTQDEDFPCVLS